MRWQSIAREVISNLEIRGQLSKSAKSQILRQINNGKAVEAFRTSYSKIIPGWTIGWNKIWRKDSLIGWYGTVLTIQPLRAIAFEIESGSDYGEDVRKWLLKLYNNQDLKSVTESNDENLLTEYGFESGKIEFDKSKLRLLQRLNLDQRDKPSIERWRWSKNNGLGYTTDDGRFQITLDLVWARAIEAGLKSSNGLSAALRTFLSSLNKENKETLIESDQEDAGLNSCIEKLVFYGFAHRMIDCVRFSVPPGSFPDNAIQLWG